MSPTSNPSAINQNISFYERASRTVPAAITAAPVPLVCCIPALITRLTR